MAVITLLTDFGDKDYYVGLFKGDLYTANPSSKIVDISHSIPPYDIVTAAFFLKNIFEHFPKGTIHIARVYEQGINKQKLIAAKYRNYFFIAPDNGLLSMVFEEKPDLIIEVDMKQAKLQTLEEYYCRVVKEISFNHNIGSIGIATSNYVQKHALLPIIQENSIVGNIMYIDNFGNAISNIKKIEIQRFSKYHQLQVLYRRGDSIDRIVENYMDVPRTYSLARFNSLGYLELCVHGDSASNLLGLSIGDNIQVVFE